MVIPQELISENFCTRQEVTCFLQTVTSHSIHTVPQQHTFPKNPQRSLLSPTQSQQLRLLLFRSSFWNSLMSELRQVVLWIFVFKGSESPTLFLVQAGIYSWGWDRRDTSPSASLLEKWRHISYCQNHEADICTKLSYRFKKKGKKQQKSPTQEWVTTPPNISQAELLDSKACSNRNER